MRPNTYHTSAVAAFTPDHSGVKRPLLDTAERLKLINEIGRALTRTLDLHALYDTIWEQVSRVMDTSLFFIAHHDPENGRLHLPYLREAGKLYLDGMAPDEDTVTSTVVARGVSLLFHRLADYQDYGRSNGLGDISIGEHEPEAMIFVPLTTNDRTIGALSVQSCRPDAYSLEDVQTLSVIASQAAVAIENARLYSRSQSNVRQMRALLHMASIINSSLELETVLDSILTGMRNVVPYFLAAILLPDHERQRLDVVGATGPLAAQRRRSLEIPFGMGITGTVYSTGELLNIGDVKLFDGYVGHGLLEVRSELAVPLKRGDTVVGVLDVEREEVDSFTAEDTAALALFASQAAIAVENARLFTEQQSRVFELQAVQNIVQAITPLHDVEAIATAIDGQLQKLVHFHSFRLFLLQEAEQVLVPVSVPREDLSDIRLHVGEGIEGWVAQHGQAVIIADAQTDSRAVHIAGIPGQPESILAVPLAYEGKVRGVISLSRVGTSQFDHNALRLLEIVGAQAATALDRARLYDELRMEAVTDAVTRLYNRRYLVERFAQERSRAQRNGRPLGAIMLDIDRFKMVNDVHGHDAGDIVLQELARLVRGVVRQEDLVARYGGEEFCVLLSGIPPAGVLRVAERLRGAIQEHSLPCGAGVRSITVSAGVAMVTSADMAHELFSRADLAMYEVKRRGGNLACLASDDGVSFTFYSKPKEA